VSSDERRSDLAVMEAQEYKQKQRLKALLEARQKVEEKSDDAEELYVTGKIREDGRNTIVFNAVKEYIREGWPLLLEYAEGDGGGDYFDSRPLGQLSVAGDTIQFEGLIDVLFAPQMFTREREFEKQYPHGPSRTVVEAEQQSVPLEVSWQAYLTMTEFLAVEHDLELQFEELDDTLPMFGCDTIELTELGVESIEDIREAIKSDVDARAIKNGDGDDDE